jgi:hypothetical protein
MTRILIVIAALLLFGGGAAEAHGKQVRFLGVHPIPKAEGGGICYIEGPHVHIYVANDKVQYRVHDGENHFVGDPVAYGYDGPKFTYKGPHPIHVEGDVEWCYLDGPHFHAFAEPEGPDFKIEGDAYFYVGKPPKVYFDERPTYVKINAVYAPIVYTRPVVVVDPPDGWIGVSVAPVAVDIVAPAVIVTPPSVDIRVPMPSVHVDIGIGGSIGVGGGVIIDERHRKHDNGRHRGHWK